MADVDTSKEAVERVLDGVTDGPCKVVPCNCGRSFCNDYRLSVSLDGYMSEKDAKFYASARELVPALSRDLESMRGERDAALSELSACKEVGGCGYWRDRSRTREAERDAALAREQALQARVAELEILAKRVADVDAEPENVVRYSRLRTAIRHLRAALSQGEGK